MTIKVKDIRTALAQQYHNEWFVVDKSGCKMVELIGPTFIADEDSLFGKVSESYLKRELDWYRSMSLNVRDMAEPVPKIWKDIASPEGDVNSNYGFLFWHYDNYSQFSSIITELADNPYSRRAIAIYTRPSMHADYMSNGMRDFVCTNTVQYLIRQFQGIHYLSTVVNMRSNDATIGFRNDLAWQRYAQNEVYETLRYSGLETMGIKDMRKGPIVWQCGSLHVYESDFDLIRFFIETKRHDPSRKELEEWVSRHAQKQT